MNINDMTESKYMKKSDCEQRPILATISHLTRENLAMEDHQPEMKYVIHFQEADLKPMVLNRINAQLIAQITGSEETDDWAGKQIVCYNDPTVSFAGKLTGGIRVRAPKLRPKPEQAPAQAPADQFDAETGTGSDDIPW